MPFTGFRPLVVPVLLAVAVVALTGCTPSKNQSIPTGSQSESDSASPTPSAGESAEPEDPGIPIAIGCNQLVSPQAMYDYNPNFGLDDSYRPASGTTAARIQNLNGLACSWLNQTSGERIAVSVAHLSAASIAKIRKELAASGKAVTDFGTEGYFTVAGNSANADALSGSYWIDSSSTAFGESGDAQPIVSAALSGLGL